MASISWKTNASGDWAVAGNWSPGLVPTASYDVTISTSGTVTVTHSTGTHSAKSLYANTGTIAVTGGSLTILGNATVYGAVNLSNATLRLSGATSLINGTLTQTSGTLAVDSGVLRLNGTGNSLAGTLTASALEFSAGSDTLKTGLTLSARSVLMSGANVAFEKSFSTAGAWAQTAGTLSLGGNTLTVSGPLTLDGGIINGSGTILSQGIAAVDGYIVSGSANLRNAGQMTQTDYLYVGYAGTDTARLTNLAGATYTIANGAYVYGAANAAIANSGRMVKTGSALSDIRVSTTTTGTLAVNAGVLRLSGPAISLAGSVTGAGTLDLAGAASSFVSGLSLSVGHVVLESGVLTLGANLTYSKEWTQTGGTIALAGKTLSLSKQNNLDGGAISGAGTLSVAGTTEISGYYLTGTSALTNTGSIAQSSYLYVGYNGSDAATLTNAAGATYNLTGGSDVYGTAGSQIVNAGRLLKTGGTTTGIRVSTSSTGTISISSGALAFTGATNSFGGTIDGNGQLQLGSGSDLLASGLMLNVSQVLLYGANATLGASLAYANTWEQTAGTLSLGGKVLTLSGAANLDGGATAGAGTIAVGGVTEISGYYLTGSNVLANSGSVFQVGNLYVGYYATDTNKLSNLSTGVYTLFGGANLYGATGGSISNAGRLTKQGSGAAQVNVSLGTTGTLAVSSGVLRLAGTTNSLGGTISGAGTLALVGGASSLASGVTLSVAHVLLQATQLSLAASVTYGGEFTQTGGTLALGGRTLSISGQANLDGGQSSGAGTISVTGGGEVSGYYLTGTSVLSNKATTTQNAGLSVGYASTDTARLINNAGATYKLLNGADIAGASGGSVTNSGRLLKSGGGGVSDIAVSVASTGTVSVGAGTMAFRGGTNSFGGTIDGAGLFQLSGGATTLQNLLKLNVAHALVSGGNVTLGGALAYTGTWAQSAGTVTLGGQTLSLSGTVSLDGGTVAGSGSIALTGATQLKAIALTGSARLVNSGTVSQTGSWYLGYNSTDTSSLVNQATGTLGVFGNSDIYGVTGSSLNNAGKILKSGGSDVSSVAVATINTGNVEVGSGQMSFLSAVSGSGTFTVDAGASLRFGSTVASGSKVTLGAGADLYVNAASGFGGSIAGFALGNVIEIAGLSYNGAATSYSPTLDKLTVTNGSTSVALQFVGGHSSTDFRLVSDNGTAAIVHT